MKIRIIFILLLGLFLLNTNLMAQDISYSLAVIEDGGYVSRDDALVKRFANLVSQLKTKYYPLTKQKIGDMTAKLKEMTDKRGLTISLVKVMEGALQVKNIKYSKYLGSYLLLKEKGYTHSEIVTAILLAYS